MPLRTARGSAPWIALPLVVAALGWIVDARISLAGAIITLGMAVFFRDPEREVADGIVSPADGKVMRAGNGEVSIFLSVHNVHVVRAPYAGRVTAVERFGRGHRPAFLERGKLNAGVRVTMDTAWGEQEVRLVAGLVARRALSYHAEGAQLAAGDRLGIIRFGSRVELTVPDGARLSIEPGDRVRAGETQLAAAPDPKARTEEAAA